MRSQIEILQQIKKIQPHFQDKKNPFYIQYRILVHKLSWENAQEFFDAASVKDGMRDKWPETSRLDKEAIVKEMLEQVDLGAMFVESKDKVSCIYAIMGLIAQLWLLGPKKDKALSCIFNDFMQAYECLDYYESIFTAICNEIHVDFSRYKLRYKEGGSGFSKIVDQKGEHYRVDEGGVV